jgi:leucyl/phenylalanyl-tRNA--protein transferase
MFSLVPSASKVALILLAQYLEENGGSIIDCQLETPHLRSMGGRFIPYDEYLKIIRGEGE